MPESLKSKATNSVMWSAVERFSVQGIQFILTIIIARLVSPSDYGLIAMLGIFLAIAQTFIDSGFSNALIQKQDRTETDFSTVFYFNIVVGIIVYLLLYLCSPFIASFYNEPKLDLVTRIVGLNLIISSFSVVQRAKLTIALNFKLQAVASLIAVVISGAIGVYMAYVGYGVWAIAVQALLNNFLNTLLLWVLTKWMPSICFSWRAFRVLFKFGSKLLLAGLLNTIYLNLYSLVIGKRFSATSLGYYNRTSTIVQFPSNNLSNIINRAMYPILCETQENNEKLLYIYKNSIRIISFCIFPLMTILFCLAKPLIYIVLGEKWLPCIPLLQILCIAYIASPLMLFMSQLITIQGKSEYALKGEIYKKSTAVILLLATMPFGLEIMCIGLIIYSFFDFIIMYSFLKKILSEITLADHIRLLTPITIICIFSGIMTHIITGFISQPVWEIFVGVLLIGSCVIMGSIFMKMNELVFFKQLILKFYINRK